MFRLIKLLLSPKTMFGMAVGAAALWFSDPERGPERRAQAVDALKQRAGGVGATLPSTGTTTPASSSTADEQALWTPGDPPAEPAAAG